MSAVLRIDGVDFDVDRFCAKSSLTPCAVYRRGERVSQVSRSRRRRKASGMNIVVSDGEFDDFQRQVQEAIAFLSANRKELRRLMRFPGVEGACLDFGIERLDVAAQFDRLPPELVRLAGELGLGIEISHYAVSSDGDA